MIGTTISHYKILEKLGEGGMGVVYKAEDLKLKRTVAIKFLPKRLSVHGEERDRFMQEAQTASSLNHPNICVIHEIDEVNDETFMVMEYLDGVTLREWIRKKTDQSQGYRKPGLKESVDLATQIAEGLEKAHERGIIHRDIKSENIMVTDDGRAKIMDFGLAKLRGVSRLTKTGSTIGTIAYMSPEQIEGAETDHRSDIFSFGVLLYEMYAGQLPFQAEHEAAIMYEIMNVDPKQLTDQGIDPELNRMVMKCLEKDREVRYQSMKDVSVDLKRYRRDSEGRRIERKPVAPSGQAGAVLEVQHAPQKRSKLLIGLVTLVGIASIIIYILLTSTTKPIDSIAVLPFTITSTDSSAGMLSEGITEGIINSLSSLPSLTVMSRNSVFRYTGANVDVQEVGKKLNVKAVLLGRIVQHGDSYAISAELVDAGNERHLWGAQYTKRAADIYTLQGELSRAISEQLQVKLSGEEEKRLTRNYTENSEAYTLYLKGRYYWNKRTEDGLKKSIDYFNQAIEKDPNYALAYAGLADGYSLLVGNYFMSPVDGFPKAKVAALRALQLDNELAEAHTSLAIILEGYEWDWTGSEREYKRAIELNPNYATAHHWYAINRLTLGLFDDALREIMRAQQLDPLSLRISQNVGWVYYSSRQFDKTIEQELKTIEMDSTFPGPHGLMGDAYFMKKQYGQALRAYEAEIRISGDRTLIYTVACVYAVTGRRTDALKLLEELREISRHSYVLSSAIALVHLYLGNKEEAIAMLRKAVEERDALVVSLNVEPKFDPLRPDPRFTEILRKIGLVK